MQIDPQTGIAIITTIIGGTLALAGSLGAACIALRRAANVEQSKNNRLVAEHRLGHQIDSTTELHTELIESHRLFHETIGQAYLAHFPDVYDRELTESAISDFRYTLERAGPYFDADQYDTLREYLLKLKALHDHLGSWSRDNSDPDKSFALKSEQVIALDRAYTDARAVLENEIREPIERLND